VGTIAVAVAGSILGFLRFNTHPAQVFMGDSGSQFLGFTIAVLSLMLTQSPGVVVSTALPVLLLGLPIVDTLTVMLQRLREGHSPFIADQKHLHHKLLGLGFDHHEAVAAIYLVQALFFLAAWFARFASDVTVLGLFALLAGGVVALMMLAGRLDWRWHRRGSNPAEVESGGNSRLARGIAWLSEPSRLPRWTLISVTSCALGYLLAVACFADPPKTDVRWLAGGIGWIALIGLLLEWRRTSFDWLLRGALYMAAVLAVYLDYQTLDHTGMLPLAKWVFLPLLVISVALGMRLSLERRFTITTLDVLLIFIIITLPNLPGLTGSPAHMGISLGKLVALVYGIELCVDQSKRAPRALAIGVMAFSALILIRHVLR